MSTSNLTYTDGLECHYRKRGNQREICSDDPLTGAKSTVTL